MLLKRRVWFRLLALLSPLLLVGLVELALRLAGYGYVPSFFLETKHDGGLFLKENPRFGWRFFPPAMARSPQPLFVRAEKPPNTIRIFVFGESAAMGDPEPAYGFPRQFERILQAGDSGHRFEVINTAMTAINSHALREIARDCASRQGDFWVVYAGNNEVVGPFGAGTVFGRQAPGLTFVRALLGLKRTRLGQWLSRKGTGAGNPTEWEGMELFLRNQVRSNSPPLRVVYDNFAQNLAALIETGRHSGAAVFVGTMAVNLKDCPPFASQHRLDLSRAQLAQWEGQYQRGKQAQETGDFAEALRAYVAATCIDPEFAELAFRRAQCELATHQSQQAAHDFALARDLDTLRFRADSPVNRIIRQVAGERGATLVDTGQACERRSEDGITGDELFYDHVHLNFSGNYTLAISFAAEIEKHLRASAHSSAPLQKEAEVARRLALTEFDRRRVEEEILLRFQRPPFSFQLNAPERYKKRARALAALAPAATGSKEIYAAAIALAPHDWTLRANYGSLLETLGEKPVAIQQWQEVTRLLPCEPDAWFHLGNLAYNQNQFTLAAARFNEALKLKPDCLEALNGLGLALAAQGQATNAMAHFKTALRLSPSFSAARVNLAVVLASAGDVGGATTAYRRVLELDTNNVAARINLAKLLIRRGRAEDASVLFEEALQLKPDEPLAHYGLANLLAAKGRHEEATFHYRAAVEERPDFVEARFNLGTECARSGNISEALAQFAEVVRLKPEEVDARFNYGVALAKQQRYAEAAEQFRETLRRQPTNAAAQSALQQALRLGNGQRRSGK